MDSKLSNNRPFKVNIPSENFRESPNKKIVNPQIKARITQPGKQSVGKKYDGKKALPTKKNVDKNVQKSKRKRDKNNNANKGTANPKMQQSMSNIKNKKAVKEYNQYKNKMKNKGKFYRLLAISYPALFVGIMNSVGFSLMLTFASASSGGRVNAAVQDKSEMWLFMSLALFCTVIFSFYNYNKYILKSKIIIVTVGAFAGFFATGIIDIILDILLTGSISLKYILLNFESIFRHVLSFMVAVIVGILLSFVLSFIKNKAFAAYKIAKPKVSDYLKKKWREL